MRKLTQVLSVLLVFVFLAGLLPMTVPAAAETGYGVNGKFLVPIDAPDPDAIKIYTEQDLWNINKDRGGSYVLMNDIDLSGFNGGKWEPIGDYYVEYDENGDGDGDVFDTSFTGVFDGQGYVIRNLKITGNSEREQYNYGGLFGYVTGATIKNVGLEGTDINITRPVNGAAVNAGGICGGGDAFISNCYNTGDISADNQAGGICGDGSTIKNCYNTGSVSGHYAGGIRGGGGGTTYNCYNTGSVSGSYVGGITGYGGGEISYCYNTGNINSTSNNIMSGAGGIRGASFSKVSYCYNTGSISGMTAGGICGYVEVVTNNDSISDCYNTGDISSAAPTQYDYARAGGICGTIASRVSISGEVGTSTVRNCYSTGSVSASAHTNERAQLGGVCGASTDGIFINCYWNIDSVQKANGVKLTNQDKKGKGIGTDIESLLTSEEMKLQSSFDGFDFGDIWGFRSGVNYDYPILQAFSSDDSSGIDYSNPDIILTGETFSFSSVSGQGGKPDATTRELDATINLTYETLNIPSKYTIQAYSTDAGKTWKTGTLTDTAFVKLLDKSLELWLCYMNYNSKAKKPQGSGDEHNIIAFAKINKRATTPTLVVNYEIGEDMGSGTGEFLLTERNGATAVKDSIEIGVPDFAGKKVNSFGFGKFYSGEENGIPLAKMSNGKVVKSVYFVRTAPTQNGDTYTAASKPKKITVAGEQKPPQLKIDYKKEIIKLKKGDAYLIGSDEAFTVVTKQKGNIELDISDAITCGASIKIKKAATANKPATAVQTITPVARITLENVTLICSNGRMTLDTKKYEVYDEVKKKWGGAPKPTASGEYSVRLKSTAKVTKNNTTGNAASLTGKLLITYGEYTDSSGKTKNGIIAAEIIGEIVTESF